MDMDLDELLDGPGPAEGTSRRSQFAPKGAKPKLKPKTEKKEEVPDMKLEPPVVAVKDEVKKEEGDDLMETDEMAVPTEEEGDDDDVVREIDVYMNPPIDDDTLLYVFQYPLRPVWRPYELDDFCQEVRVKPKTREVEVDVALDLHSKNYDHRAIISGGGEQMTKQTLATTWQPPPVSGYAIGVFKGNQLHLNPVHAVVQLRPSMQHLDPKESRRKTNAANNGEKIVKVENPGTSSRTSKKAGAPVGQTNDSAEDWIPLKYHGGTSDKASRCRHNMAVGESLPVNFPMSSSDYLDNLCPGTSIASLQSMRPSKRLMNLSLEERLKTRLREAPIHKFDWLKYLAPEESVEEVLNILEQHALLVQGLWVPKTSLVLDQGNESAARDTILLLFSKNVLIKNSQLYDNRFGNLQRECLQKFAVERPTLNDWKLREAPDMNFIKLYPSIVIKQREQWARLEEKVNAMFPKGGRKLPTNTTDNPANSRSSNEVGTKIANGANSNRASSEEVQEAISKALPKFFKIVKVCRSQHMSRQLREHALSEHQRSTPTARDFEAAADFIDASPDDSQAIISQVAVNIHGVWVPKSSQDYPKFDPLREVVLDLLLAEGPNAKLKKATILEAAKVKLGTEVPPTDLQKVLQEICKSQGQAWVLKSGDGSPN